MKLCVKGPSGLYHALDISEDVTIGQLKEELAVVEDIPADLLLIRFAGKELIDTVPIGEYTILGYSLQEEVLLYLERKTAEPMTIFIKHPANRNSLITEVVEETATIEDVMGIMQNLEVVAAWAETADTIVKRTTGSSIQNLGIKRTHTLREVHGIISDAQGFDVKMMTFMESLDGHLHIQVQPSEDPHDVREGGTLTYNLSRPQRQMKKLAPTHDHAAVAVNRKKMLDEELSNAPKLYFNRRLMKIRGKVEFHLFQQATPVKHVRLELENRKVVLLRDIEFAEGSTDFADSDVAHDVLRELAVVLSSCNQIMAAQDREPKGPVSLSLDVSGPESSLAAQRAGACREILVKKLYDLSQGGGVVDSLVQVGGQSSADAAKALVEIRVTVPNDVGPVEAVPAIAAAEDGAAPLPEMYNDLTRDHCLMGRSTDYDPFHTWLPHHLRKTNPWPVNGPKKPDP